MILQDKVAIVTGAASGIGLAITKLLLEKGCSVCLVDINTHLGTDITNKLEEKYGQKVLFTKCDITDYKSFEDVFDKVKVTFGTVHIVCNVAGVVSEFSISTMVEVNVKGVMYGTTIAVERMRKDMGGEGGVIVNVSSDAGIYPAWMMPGYSGTKAAVINFTRAWSMNPKRKEMDISFVTLCPAATDTPMIAKLQHNVLDIEALYAFDDANGFQSSESVAQVFHNLVTEDHNGDVIHVSKKDGPVKIDLPSANW